MSQNFMNSLPWISFTICIVLIVSSSIGIHIINKYKLPHTSNRTFLILVDTIACLLTILSLSYAIRHVTVTIDSVFFTKVLPWLLLVISLIVISSASISIRLYNKNNIKSDLNKFILIVMDIIAATFAFMSMFYIAYGIKE